jgi:hypothetical protein
VYRSKGQSREWESFKGNIIEDEEEELLAEDIEVSDISRLYADGTALRVYLDGCPLGSKVREAVERGIASRIRGASYLNEVTVTAGEHDLFEALEKPDGHYFGRAFFSVAIAGYRIPEDCDAYRAQIMQLPEIMEIRSPLEGMCGPLSTCVYWTS